MANDKLVKQAIDLLNKSLAPTPQIPASSNIKKVKNGESIQAAIDSAVDGDEIRIEPGAYDPFILKNRIANSYVSILPDIAVLDVNNLPLVIHSSKNNYAIKTESNASFYNIAGFNVISLSEDDTLIGLESGHHFIIDRCNLDGKSACKRGIAANGSDIQIINNKISGIKKFGQDTQCISCTTGAGPLLIQNNYLSGGAEVVLIGGADPTVNGLVPTDIKILYNILTRDYSWRDLKQVTKNTLELKNAKNVLIEGNIIENCWLDGQTGFLVQFTVRNQNGKAPWSTIQDVEMRWNVLRHGNQGINILALDDINDYQSVRMKNINIHDNLMYDIDKDKYGGGSTRLIMINNGIENGQIVRNTMLGNVSSGLTLSSGRSNAKNQLVMTDNIMAEGSYGIKNSATGVNAWSAHTTPDSTFKHNAIIKGTSGRKIIYPDGNLVIADSNVKSYTYDGYGVNIEELMKHVIFL